MRIFLFILCFFFFSFAFLVLKFDVLFVGCLFFFPYGQSKQTRSLSLLELYYNLHDVQSVTLIIGFIHDQRIFFTLCDRRREGVVPANTLKRLVRKRKYKNIFS